MRSSKPLNTDKTIISAAVPIVTPSTDIIEMILMARCDFLEKKYRLAMKGTRFIESVKIEQFKGNIPCL